MAGLTEKGYRILKDAAGLLGDVPGGPSMGAGYACLCGCAMRLAKNTGVCTEEGCFPVDAEKICRNLGIEVRAADLNKNPEDGSAGVNRIAGMVSVRPDYFGEGKKVTVYVDANEKKPAANYAIVRELYHLLLFFRDAGTGFFRLITVRCPSCQKIRMNWTRMRLRSSCWHL